MFTSIGNWIKEVQSSGAQRQRRVLVCIVGVFFILICGIWFVAIQLGFIDWQGEWISGTRTYNASGTLESSIPDSASVGQKWDETKNAVGDAFRNIGDLFGNALHQIETPATSTPPTTIISTSTVSTTTIITP